MSIKNTNTTAPMKTSHGSDISGLSSRCSGYCCAMKPRSGSSSSKYPDPLSRISILTPRVGLSGVPPVTSRILTDK